jgi:hypothetical protein
VWRACEAATAVVGDNASDIGPPLQPVPEDDRDLASSAEIWRACQAAGGFF